MGYSFVKHWKLLYYNLISIFYVKFSILNVFLADGENILEENSEAFNQRSITGLIPKARKLVITLPAQQFNIILATSYSYLIVL